MYDPQFEGMVADKRRDLLVRLLQRETMKDAVFKSMQLRSGGGIAPTQDVDAQAREMAEALVEKNADVVDLIGNAVNDLQQQQRQQVQAQAQAPRLDMNTVRAQQQQDNAPRRPPRPQSARSDSRRRSRSPRAAPPRPSSRTSSRPQSARSTRGKNNSDNDNNDDAQWSPIAEAIGELYRRTAHLRAPSPAPSGSQSGVRSRPASAGSARRPSQSSQKPTAAQSEFGVGDEIKARSRSRQEYRKATIIAKNGDGTYDLRYEFKKPNAGANTQAGRKFGSHIPSAPAGLQSVGIKRLKQIVRDKIEQRCRSSSSGSMATVNPHVLKQMFSRFDTDGGGSLDRDEFAAAMRGELGLVNISAKDMNALMDEYDEDGDGEITYEEFTKQIFVPDFGGKNGSIIDYPSAHNSYDPKENLSNLIQECKHVLTAKSKHLRKIFRQMAVLGANDDGEVRRNEFIAFLRNNNIGVGKEAAMNHLFAMVDKDKSGSISFTEFASALNSADQEKMNNNFFIGGGRKEKKGPRWPTVCIGRKRLHLMLLDKIEQKAKGTSSFARTSEHVMRKLFKEFDTDDSGELDKDEFRNALRWKLGLMNISTKDIDDLFDHYDTDGGGGIDVDEFIDKVMPKDFTSENGVIDLPCTTSLKVSHFGLFYAFHFCPLTCLLVVSEVCFGRRCPPRFHVSFDV